MSDFKPPVGMPGIGGMLGQCALCGESFVVECVLGKKVLSITVPGCENTLYCHPECRKKYEGKEWEYLPDKSPLKQAFQKALATSV